MPWMASFEVDFAPKVCSSRVEPARHNTEKQARSANRLLPKSALGSLVFFYDIIIALYLFDKV